MHTTKNLEFYAQQGITFDFHCSKFEDQMLVVPVLKLDGEVIDDLGSYSTLKDATKKALKVAKFQYKLKNNLKLTKSEQMFVEALENVKSSTKYITEQIEVVHKDNFEKLEDILKKFGYTQVIIEECSKPYWMGIDHNKQIYSYFEQNNKPFNFVRTYRIKSLIYKYKC
jgi:ribosomal protein S16